MAQLRERRVTFSSEENKINSSENELTTQPKKEHVIGTPPSPILKMKSTVNSKPKLEVIQPLLTDSDLEDLSPVEDIPVSTEDEKSTDDHSRSKPLIDLSESLEDEHHSDNEDYNTAKMLRERSRQLMRQYVLRREHSDSIGRSVSDTESHDQSDNNGSIVEINNSFRDKKTTAKNSQSKCQQLQRQSMTVDSKDDITPANPFNCNVEAVESPRDATVDSESSTLDEDSSWTSHSYIDGGGLRNSSSQLIISEMDNVNRFAIFDISSSKQKFGETFLGMDWLDRITQRKFVALSGNEEVLFVGVTGDNASLKKGFFDMVITNSKGKELLHLRRIYSVKSNSTFEVGVKKRCRLEVRTPSGFVIGNVEKTYSNDSYYILEDRAGDCLLLIKRNCVTIDCPLLWDYEFKVLLPDYTTEVGEISWSCLTAQHENFYGTEISFPADLSHYSKSLLLGTCFLLNCSRRHGAYLYNKSSSLWWKKSKESLKKKTSKLLSSYRASSSCQNGKKIMETSTVERGISTEEPEDDFR
ncbi:hypothetical protein CHUAL_003242 [Chamberlinius hualienensis]